MLPITAQAFEDLERAQWFSRVGVVDTAAARVVGSWGEAIALCSTIDWENFLIDRANDFRDRLRAISVSDYNRWNSVAIPVKRVAEQMIVEKTHGIVRALRMPPEFVHRIRVDLIHMAIELEYSEICPPGFFAGQGGWYVKGHFPCGWEGAFPKGRLIVY